MRTTSERPHRSTLRDLHFLANPTLWTTWPFLPLVRRSNPGELECGVLFDARAVGIFTGYRCTVFATNLFTLPRSFDAFIGLPKEVFDTFDEVIDAGWRVD